MKPQEVKLSENFRKVKPDNDSGLPLRINSSAILNRDGKLIIDHNGEEYILRITRSGKLILTK